MLHVEALRQLPLLLALTALSLVDGRNHSLPLHYLSALGVYLGSEGYALHAQLTLLLYSLLDALLLLLLPQRHRGQEVVLQAALRALLLPLLGYYVPHLVLLHFYCLAGVVIAGEALVLRLGLDPAAHGLLPMLGRVFPEALAGPAEQQILAFLPGFDALAPLDLIACFLDLVVLLDAVERNLQLPRQILIIPMRMLLTFFA